MSLSRAMFSLFAVFLFLAPIECDDSRLVIKTTTGTYKGELIHSRKNDIIKFKAVRYAEPPVGALRFKPPQPLENIVETIMPNEISICYQPEPSIQYGKQNKITDNMSEDCLFLNIYTPASLNEGKIYSTIVWISGESPYKGSITADATNPEYLVSKQEVIVIQVQYRMGSFGFLSVENTNIKGNMGLLDQVAALQWIKENIQKFSGNSSDITLMGYGFGAAMVGFHLMSDKTTGLFQKVMMHSGSPYEENLFHTPPVSHRISAKISKSIGCNYNNDAYVESCFMRASASRLVQADSETPKLAPTQDNNYLGTSLAIPIIKNKFREIPILASFVQNEGMKKFLVFLESEKDIDYNSFTKTNYDTFMKKMIEYTVLKEIIPKLSDFYIEQYTRNATIDYREIASQFFGDYLTTCLAHEFLKYASFNGKNLYLYTFNHRSKKDKSPKYTEVTHGSDIPYLFGTLFLESEAINYNGPDRSISEQLMMILGEFTKNGNPGKGWLKYDTYFVEEIKDSRDETSCKPKKPFCEQWWKFRRQI